MKEEPIIRSFSSREQANRWAYDNGTSNQRLYVVTEDVDAPFTYWVLCNDAFDVAITVPEVSILQSYRILSVYE